jgi:hypothetical protein
MADRSPDSLTPGAAQGPSWPRGWFGTIADIIQVVVGLIAVLALVINQSARQAILALFLCLLTAIAIWKVFSLARELARQAERHHNEYKLQLLKQERQIHTVESLPDFVESAKYMARGTVAALDPNRHREFLLLVEEGAQRLARAFTIATARNCRVTLKEIYAYKLENGNEELAVRTLCTGGESEPRRSRPRAESVDLVSNNTDFYQLVIDNLPYYLCNDIPKAVAEGEYENSHFTTTMVASRNYPYRSTICWPVGNKRDEDFDLQGFLCVDSSDIDVFEVHQDVPLGQAFAYALYSGLRAFRQSQPNTEGNKLTDGREVAFPRGDPGTVHQLEGPP